MDYSKIDELYQIYLDELLGDAIDQFEIYYKKYQMNGNHNLIDILKNYIKEQTQNFSNSFVSNKDEKNKVDYIVRETTSVFEAMVTPVQFYMDECVYDDAVIEELTFDGLKHDMLRPHDLFNMDIKFIEEAVEKHGSTFAEAFKKAINLLKYVKKTKLLDALYKDGTWHEMNFSELIANLYDKAKNKSVFEVEYDGILTKEDSLFDKVKENCSRVSSLAFDKYRPQLNSSKQMSAEFGKLIFCKNLLSYYKTGIMPFTDGMVDWTTSEYEQIQMIDEFKDLYSKNFDEMSFRTEQLNIICKPEVITSEYTVDAARKISLGNRMIIGFIVDATCLLADNSVSFKYLIHINVEDVNNPYSNYEIQLNILPQGKISQRLQLMRLDNWDSEQPHKNVARKLKTTTHIHLYNEFDLLRGKENGNYDIAYNLDSKSTDFETSLKTFLDILEFDENMQRKIYNSVIKTLNKCKTTEKTTEV